VIAAVAVTLLAVRPQPHQGCQPFWPTPNRTNPLNLAYLKAHSQHTDGSLPLSSPTVTGHFQSRDPRNFAAEVSVAEYSVAFGLPATDMQNPFYRMAPARRLIVVVSYGSFQEPLNMEFGSPADPRAIPYSVGVLGLDASDGTLLTAAQIPVCK
jgi:hypothetical protein